jgi:hypothetical protein
MGFNHMEKKIRQVDTMLEIGPGIHPQLDFSKHYLAIEPHSEYAEFLEKKGLFVIQNTAYKALKFIRKVDSIILLDVLEHMVRQEAELVLGFAKAIARVQVIVFTTLGFIPQDYKDGKKDAWGMNGDYWQTHRSEWHPEDFSGWDVAVEPHFHGERGGAIYAIHTV